MTDRLAEIKARLARKDAAIEAFESDGAEIELTAANRQLGFHIEDDLRHLVSELDRAQAVIDEARYVSSLIEASSFTIDLEAKVKAYDGGGEAA